MNQRTFVSSKNFGSIETSKFVLNSSSTLHTTTFSYSSLFNRSSFNLVNLAHSNKSAYSRYSTATVTTTNFLSRNSHRNYSSMAPLIVNYDGYLDKLITDNRVLIFSKTTCPFCVKVKYIICFFNFINFLSF